MEFYFFLAIFLIVLYQYFYNYIKKLNGVRGGALVLEFGYYLKYSNRAVKNKILKKCKKEKRQSTEIERKNEEFCGYFFFIVQFYSKNSFSVLGYFERQNNFNQK
ncbi:hypothetical protein BpHYR1_053769 [Brachionus plicatilis]|uniref:Uncharacterized protein n=1 Tax=Brachionus plicatilis TaxID=10195 RepID=A0A3M7RPP9_BRAPC|nr:hypothetical protein BpHYR1_053769 [Brachionus plicatilis]